MNVEILNRDSPIGKIRPTCNRDDNTIEGIFEDSRASPRAPFSSENEQAIKKTGWETCL